MSVITQLWEIYRKKLPLLRTDTKENWFIGFFALSSALISLLTTNACFGTILQNTTQLLATIWGGILGLITAGLAIFLQALNPDYLIKLYEIRDDKTGLRHLELRLVCFIEAFWFLLWGMVIFLFVYMLALTDIARLILPLPQLSLVIIKFCIFWIIGVSIGTGLFQLMSLAYNLYSSTITQAAALKIWADREKKKKKGSK